MSWDKESHSTVSLVTEPTWHDEPDEVTTSSATSGKNSLRWGCSLIPTETQESHFLSSRITKLLVNVATDFSFLLQKSLLHYSATSQYQYLYSQVLCSSALSLISHRFPNCGAQKNRKNQPI